MRTLSGIENSVAPLLRTPAFKQARVPTNTRCTGRSFSRAINRWPASWHAIRRKRDRPPGKASATRCPPNPCHWEASTVSATSAPPIPTAIQAGDRPTKGPNTASMVAPATAAPAVSLETDPRDSPRLPGAGGSIRLVPACRDPCRPVLSHHGWASGRSPQKPRLAGLVPGGAPQG